VLALLENTVAQRTAELRRSEAYLVEAQRLTHTGCWAVNILSREILYSSDEHSRLYGFDPGLGLPPFAEFHQRIHPDDRDRVVHNLEAASQAGAGVDTQFRVVLPDGTTRYMQAIGHSVTNTSDEVGEFVGILMDITERRRSDEERETLRQAQADLAHVNRVTTMGELTASLAHEIKQPITAAATDARTCLRWLRRDEPDVAEACDAASRTVKAVTRAADIISSISVLFQKGALQRERVDVNELIREMILLLRTEANRDSIIIQTELDPELPWVLADRVQLQQVFMNLMLNGIDAMKAQGGAHVLTIRSHVDNGQLVIAVSDTVSDCRRRRRTRCSGRSSRPRITAPAWGYRSAAPSSSRMAAASGRPTTPAGAPRFSSACRPPSRHTPKHLNPSDCVFWLRSVVRSCAAAPDFALFFGPSLCKGVAHGLPLQTAEAVT
jgi:C4-dicarboxylate-specific signal transduction histidine kinase